MPEIPVDRKPRLAADYRPKNAADRARYLDWAYENFEPWDQPFLPAPRKRRPNAAALIRRARKAGELGTISVTLPDGTTLTSNAVAEGHQPDISDSRDDWAGLQ
jgi:hypothetical protein